MEDRVPAKPQARACRVCQKAKVKCVVPAASLFHQCRRCERLGKQCSFGARSTPNTSVSDSPGDGGGDRMTRLEERLETVIAFLSSQRASAPSSASRASSTAASSFWPSRQPSSATSLVANWAADSVWFDLPAGEAAALLDEYRSIFAPQFPFVYIPPESSVESLLRTRPFVWKAIVSTASCRNLNRQLEFRKRLMEDFSRNLLSIDAEGSLDLLQALLIYVAWYHYLMASHHHLTNLVSLIKALVISLRLDRSPAIAERRRLLTDGMQDTYINEPEHRERLRTLAGASYLTSVVAASCRKLEPLRHTAYVISGCESISSSPETPADTLISPLVRLQMLIQSIRTAIDASSSADPIRLHMGVLRTELSSLTSGLSKEVRENAVLEADLNMARVMLSEYSIVEYPLPAMLSTGQKGQKIEDLHGLLVATKTYFESLCATDFRSTISCSFIVWIQLGTVLLIAIRLSLLRVDGWDLSYVQEHVRIEENIASLAQRLELAADEQGGGDESTVFQRFAAKFKQIRDWYMSAAKHQPSDTMDTAQIHLGQGLPGSGLAGDTDLESRLWDELYVNCSLQNEDGLMSVMGDLI